MEQQSQHPHHRIIAIGGFFAKYTTGNKIEDREGVPACFDRITYKSPEISRMPANKPAFNMMGKDCLPAVSPAAEALGAVWVVLVMIVKDGLIVRLQ
ncbi:hypothetical protein [Paraflavitalea speifideaquila]|uniref:hypothetical protein n=1 Tax=Paraflavitalea speifideaquila TaxID=3076558 RepID=UPI0028E42DCC|nr:hypothetical protein [Paraflavitalea speifideiaquila]